MLGRPWRMTGYLPLNWCILTEILKWTCTKQWRCSAYLLRHEGQILDNFKKFLSIKVIKIELDSILYETLKWSQIAPFCISSKKKNKNPRPPLPLKNYGVHTINPQLRPWYLTQNEQVFSYILARTNYILIRWWRWCPLCSRPTGWGRFL